MAGLSARRTAGITVLLGASILVLGVPTVVGAQDVAIEISLDTVVRGPQGSQHVLASEEVPGDLVGRTCSVAAVSTNQQSVHPGNDLVISSNGARVVLEDVEGEAFGERAVEASLTLGPQLTVTLIMGPDGVFSAGMVTRVRCRAQETTTTTTETTVPETTTTVAGETTTTVPETTTTVTGETTTTVPETTTTGPGSTTTTGETTTTTGATSTTDSTLPLTGVGSVTAVGVAMAGLLAGTSLLVLSRRADDHGAGLVTPTGHTDLIIEGIPVRLVRTSGTDLVIEGIPVRLIRPGQ